MQLWGPLEDDDVEPDMAQRYCCRQSTDPAADDECPGHGVSSPGEKMPL
jgi:hypothetical protein